MVAAISEAVRRASQEIASAEESDLAVRLNAALGSILPGFYVGPGRMVDADGMRSPSFASVIATEAPGATAGIIRADAVACVAYLCKTLDAASLTDGYKRIRAVRELRKTPSAVDSQTTITLGLIVAADGRPSLDEIASEMRDLDRDIEDSCRPDMVAVLSQGTVGYGTAFFDDATVGGFLPPARGSKLVPPINVHLLVTETETHALNKIPTIWASLNRDFRMWLPFEIQTSESTYPCCGSFPFDMVAELREALRSRPDRALRIAADIPDHALPDSPAETICAVHHLIIAVRNQERDPRRHNPVHHRVERR